MKLILIKNYFYKIKFIKIKEKMILLTLLSQETFLLDEEEQTEKPLWEICVDFYNEHKEKIVGLTLVGSLLYSGYKMCEMSKEMERMREVMTKDIKELERRITENKEVLMKMDTENSKINMWFSQKPKIPEPKKKYFLNNANVN